MPNEYVRALRAVLDTCGDWGITLDDEDALDQLIIMFTPYPGDQDEDDEHRAVNERPMLAAQCSNCGFRWPVMPAGTYVEAERLALTAMRMAVCPRCFNSESIVLKGDWG